MSKRAAIRLLALFLTTSFCEAVSISVKPSNSGVTSQIASDEHYFIYVMFKSDIEAISSEAFYRIEALPNSGKQVIYGITYSIDMYKGEVGKYNFAFNWKLLTPRPRTANIGGSSSYSPSRRKLWLSAIKLKPVPQGVSELPSDKLYPVAKWILVDKAGRFHSARLFVGIAGHEVEDPMAHFATW